jgi:hypothetical protein
MTGLETVAGVVLAVVLLEIIRNLRPPDGK